MKWNERISKKRKELGLSQEQVVTGMARYLEKEETVGKAALSSWEQGRTQPKVQHALALARVLDNTDVGYLFGNEQMAEGLNEAGQRRLAEYRQLLMESPRYRRQPKPARVRMLPVYLQPASAGTGQWLDDSTAEQIEVDAAVPASAQFGVRLAGDSMQPRFSDGQIVWARETVCAESGEIVLCWLDGQSYCKKLRTDEHGTELISLNKAYRPIPVTESTDFRVFGVVVG